MYVCNNGNKILSDLPRWRNGSCNGKIDRESMVGMNFDIEYNGKTYKDIKILNYIKGVNSRFIIEYNGHINKKGILCGHFLNGKFGEILNLINHDFNYNVGQNIGDFKILQIGYIYSKKGHRKRAYNVSCVKCGFDGGKHYKNGELVDEYWIEESNLKINNCPCCGKINKIIVQGINDMYTTNHWMVELGVDEEFAKTHTSRSTFKAPCKCPHCGEEKYKKIDTIYKDKSISCACNDGISYPFKFVYNLLKQLDIEFETEYSPDYLIPIEGKKYRKRSDFYIHSLKLVVEVDGGLGHEGGIVHRKSNKTLEEHIEIDNWKDKQHLNHGIKTIRINCFKSDMEYIKENILNSLLVDYFDFNNIDWNKCEEFALKNLVKEVCDYWNSKEEWETTDDLTKIFNVSRNTIIKYLKRGAKLDWCNYNPNHEMAQRGFCAGKLNSKKVEIFKDYVSLGTFEGVAELSRQSEELFGVKLNQPNISNVCNGKKQCYKNFMFKYV